ncbi:MAG: MFS transporter [Chitinivibrionales bacterium]|nr:MFS transporter [Chitinivibrionales bacterium]
MRGHTMSRTHLHTQIRILYALRVCSGALACSVPVVVLFWRAHGLSLTQITLLQCFFALVLTALEVPSGYLADRWGRRRTLVVGTLGLAAGVGVYLFADTYLHFFVAELLFALGIAMASGADAAWLFDTLQAAGLEEEYQRRWGSAQALSMVGYALFSSCGGVLYELHPRAPWLVAFVVSLMAVPCALALRETPTDAKPSQRSRAEGLLNVLRLAIEGNRGYRDVLLRSALVLAAFQVGLWFYQPYFELSGIRPAWFGPLFASFNLVAAFASRNAERLDRFTARMPYGVAQLAAVGLGFMGMGLLRAAAGVPLIFVHQVVRGWHVVSVSHRVNRLVSSERRATLLSLVSMTNRGLYGLIVPLGGLAADRLGLPHALLLTGTVVSLGGFWLWLPRRSLAAGPLVDSVAGAVEE